MRDLNNLEVANVSGGISVDTNSNDGTSITVGPSGDIKISIGPDFWSAAGSVLITIGAIAGVKYLQELDKPKGWFW